MITSTKRYLLDFDGVLYNNKNAFSYITKRASQFVHKKMKLPGRNADFRTELLNTNLYKTYGHTVEGLNACGYKTTIQEFNEFVYDNFPYNDFKESIKIPDKENIYIFSNAPKEYCEKLIKHSPCQLRETRNINYIQDVIGHDYILKPDKKIYNDITNAFLGDIIVFVDDALINLVPSEEFANWINILYIPEMKPKLLGNNMIIGNMKHLDLII